MKYYLLEADERIPQPQFLNWYEEMPPRLQTAGEVPRLNRFVVKLPGDVAFLDIVTYPYFLLSKEFTELARLYEPELQWRYAVLYDRANRRHGTYGMPLLETVDCLAPESERNRDHSVLRRGILRREAVRGRSLFRIGGVKNRYVAASLELVESALRREAQGLRIRELELE